MFQSIKIFPEECSELFFPVFEFFLVGARLYAKTQMKLLWLSMLIGYRSRCR